MVYPVQSLGLHGITGYPVSVECDLSGGLPAFTVVGLPDAAVNEARERVRSAIKNCGFTFPVSRITVNLAPAHVKKLGTLYDLPILVGLLAAGGQLKIREEGCAFLGELSLSGQLRPCAGMLPMALAARELGVQKLFVPRENAAEATLAGGPEIYPVADVLQLARHFTGEEPISPGPDFAQVKGQAPVKRALEIAAAGSHNILMVGPPGSGKSMLAKRLPSILPSLTREEALEVTQIHSVLGLTDSSHPLITRRSIFHALNQKAVAKRYAKEIGKPYESLNLIVCHMGGGVSVGAHVKGEVVDTGNALEGEGPFSPERSGTLPSGALVDLCFSGKYTEQEIRRMITGNGGLLAYTGSTDMQELMRRAATDAKVREVIDAFHYRVAKEIGAMAAAMKGQVDQIILTGGIAHGQETVDALKGYVSWIAPVTVYPGEGELLALAEGALRVLRGEETAKIYE